MVSAPFSVFGMVGKGRYESDSVNVRWCRCLLRIPGLESDVCRVSSRSSGYTLVYPPRYSPFLRRVSLYRQPRDSATVVIKVPGSSFLMNDEPGTKN
jgi:hypothetical protein